MALAWVNIFDTGTVQLLDSTATESAGVITAPGEYSQGGVLCGPITGQRASVTLDAGTYTGRMRITIYEATYDSPYSVAVGFVTEYDGTIPLPAGEHIDSFPCIVGATSVQIGFGVNYGNGGSGSASFKIEVETDVEEGLVANDDTALTTAATPVAVDVLANDTLEGSPVGINDLFAPPTVVSAPANGVVVWNADTERFDYTPNAGFCGTDTFEYGITTPGSGPFIPPLVTALATIEVTGCPDGPPSLQPPGSGRNTPIVRVSERNGLTVFFPGEADRTCIQGTCPVAAGGEPAPAPGCVEVILQGSANNNQEPFDAPGFEWGVTPSFILIPPGEAQEGIIFEWIGDEGRYFSETGAECGDGEQEEGWTFTLGEPGSPSGCAIVLAGCS